MCLVAIGSTILFVPGLFGAAPDGAMTDEEAQRASRWVLELWQPDWHGDDGEELILQQRVFARGRR